jgi:pSer/pThr/pTyr-binding forkhead associated (FHA) protein
MTDPRDVSLRFLSGAERGKTLTLAPGQTLVFGRAGADVVLSEESVSRQHARFSHEDGALWVVDLGSTNGTFVNGTRLRDKARLAHGDRVLVGTQGLVVSAPSERAPQPSGATSEPPGRTRTMSGSIAEIPLPDVLQLLGGSRKSGVVEVRSEDRLGRVHLRRGMVARVEIVGSEGLGGVKALSRMLAWSEGTFELLQEGAPPLPPEADRDLPLQETLMEALQHMDELVAARVRLPTNDSPLRIARPLLASLADLPAADLELLRLAHNVGTVGGWLDAAPLSDAQAARILARLLEGGYLVAS